MAGIQAASAVAQHDAKQDNSFCHCLVLICEAVYMFKELLPSILSHGFLSLDGSVCALTRPVPEARRIMTTMVPRNLRQAGFNEACACPDNSRHSS